MTCGPPTAIPSTPSSGRSTADVRQTACLRNPVARRRGRAFLRGVYRCYRGCCGNRRRGAAGDQRLHRSARLRAVLAHAGRLRDRGPGRLLEDPLRAARLLHDEPADLWKGHLLGEDRPDGDRVSPGVCIGRWRSCCRRRSSCVGRWHQSRRIHRRAPFPRGWNTLLHRGPHDCRAGHPCDVLGRAGLRRHDDRRGRTLQPPRIRRAYHRFRPAVYREPGAFHGWHVLPSAVRHD